MTSVRVAWAQLLVAFDAAIAVTAGSTSGWLSPSLLGKQASGADGNDTNGSNPLTKIGASQECAVDASRLFTGTSSSLEPISRTRVRSRRDNSLEVNLGQVLAAYLQVK